MSFTFKFPLDAHFRGRKKKSPLSPLLKTLVDGRVESPNPQMLGDGNEDDPQIAGFIRTTL